jgi:hypothetical protein
MMRAAIPIAAMALAAVALAPLVVRVNLDRSCVTHDADYFSLCSRDRDNAQTHQAALTSRIAKNAGDTTAYVQLAMSDESPQRDSALQAASILAPHHPAVLRLRTNAALQKKDWAGAVDPLVELVEHHGNEQAALTLARLIAGGQAPLLATHIQPGRRWLKQVLEQIPKLRVSISTALPLVIQALAARVLEPATVMNYVQELKAAGAWADAYALWLGLNGNSLPALYNAGFDLPFQPEGFDWEPAPKLPASKAGAILDQHGSEGRGAVLGIVFTGRKLPTPLVKQTLFVSPGRYRLNGEYVSHQLRMEEGFAWTIRCAEGGAVAGRSEALSDTGGAWRRFSFEFNVPPDCGLVANLQLEPYATYAAALGARGRVDFDAFSLEKVAL